VYRERFDVQKLLPSVRGHSQEGRKYPNYAQKKSLPAQRNKQKDHLYYFPERIDHISVQRHYVVARKCRSEEHTSALQSRENLVCRLLLEKKKFLRFGRSLRHMMQVRQRLTAVNT